MISVATRTNPIAISGEGLFQTLFKQGAKS
jgi:hypothetical protein